MKTRQILYWLPRLLSFVWIGFTSLFALDAFDAQDTVFDSIGHFATHLILPAVLSLLLFWAWFKPLPGGLALLAGSLVMGVLVYRLNFGMNHNLQRTTGTVLLLTGPFFLSALGFIAEGWNSRRA